jgi:hypothetical protein
MALMVNEETVRKVADATKAVAETAGKAIDVGVSVGRIVKGPIETIVGMVNDQLRFVRDKNSWAIEDKTIEFMKARGMCGPTRELPLKFAVPLLTHAFLEEDEDLQETWARLLVNAGDASTDMELRTAYVDILAGMSAFDVRNLSLMAEVTLESKLRPFHPVQTWLLPNSATVDLPGEREMGEVSSEVGISLANLSRLGCAMPGGP